MYFFSDRPHTKTIEKKGSVIFLSNSILFFRFQSCFCDEKKLLRPIPWFSIQNSLAYPHWPKIDSNEIFEQIKFSNVCISRFDRNTMHFIIESVFSHAYFSLISNHLFEFSRVKQWRENHR